MRTIWKFRLGIGATDLEVPEGSKVRMVAVQHGEPYIWIEVIPDKPLTKSRFVICGTGYSIPEECVTYHGSFMLEDGFFVGHVYGVPSL